MGDITETPTTGLTLEEGHGAAQVLIGLNKQRETGRYCNITLKVDGKSFQAHKNILASFSPFFAARISEDPVKSDFVVEGIKAEIFEMILDYGYLCSIKITDDNAVALLRAATRLEVSSLAEVCGEYLGKTANKHNFVKLYELATEVSCASLAEFVNKYAREYFSEVIQQNAFLEIKPEQLIDIIKSEDLKIKNEEVVFDAVLRWVKHTVKRESLLPKVLVYVRLAFINPEFLGKRVQEEEVIRSSTICMQWISEVLLFKLHQGIAEPQQTFITPRLKSLETEVILVVDDGPVVMSGYSIEHDKWFTFNTLYPGNVKHAMASAVDGNSVFMLGDVSKCGRTLCRYDSFADEWKGISEDESCWHSLLGRINSSLAWSNWYLYVTKSIQSVYGPEMKRFDIKRGAWASVAKMPIPLYDCAVVALQEMIYCIGGSYRHETKKTFLYSLEVQRYNPRTNQWLRMTPFPQGCLTPGRAQRLLCCAFDGKIYVIDGTQNNLQGDLTKPMVYNLAQNKWEPGAPLHQAYMNPAALMVVNERLTFIDSSRFPYLEIEQFNPRNTSWEIYEKEVKFPHLGKCSFHIVHQAVKARLT